jgi:hypothetical protein
MLRQDLQELYFFFKSNPVLGHTFEDTGWKEERHRLANERANDVQALGRVEAHAQGVVAVRRSGR